MIYAALILGCVLLFKGGDWLLDGLLGIGHRLKMSTAMIGLVLVSLGTSAPELFVSVGSAIQGHGAIAAGNVVGSNIINISIVLGVTLCVVALRVERMLLQQLFVVLGLSVMALWFMSDGLVTRAEGLALVAIMVVSFFVAIKSSRKSQLGGIDEQAETQTSKSHALWLTLGGIVALVVGAECLIWGGLGLAYKFELPETVVALTVTALGTSLPEIAASVVAVVRRETDLALGNVIGSNLLNLGLVLGVSSTIIPLEHIALDVVTMAFFVGLVLLIIALSLGLSKLPRWTGFALVASYFAYVAVLLNA